MANCELGIFFEMARPGVPKKPPKRRDIPDIGDPTRVIEPDRVPVPKKAPVMPVKAPAEPVPV